MTRNVEMLVQAARALGDLRDEVVFVGGAVVDLFITDPAAPRPRFTQDVDVVGRRFQILARQLFRSPVAPR